MNNFLQSYFSILTDVFENRYIRISLLILFIVSAIRFILFALNRLIGPLPHRMSNKADSDDQLEDGSLYELEDDSFDYILKGDVFE